MQALQHGWETEPLYTLKDENTHSWAPGKKRGRDRKEGEGRDGEELPPFLKVASIDMTDAGRTGEWGPWPFPQPRELTVTLAPGKEKQGREQQLRILLKLLLKMIRHFTGKVTTI